MEADHPTFTDGTFQGQRFFTSIPNRALFVPMSSCKLFKAYDDDDGDANANATDAQRESKTESEKTAKPTDEEVRKHNEMYLLNHFWG